MGTISKYDKKQSENASDYYGRVLPELIHSAYSNIEKYRSIADKLSKNSTLDKYLVEKVTSSLDGTSIYDELTKSDIDSLIEAFQKIER